MKLVTKRIRIKREGPKLGLLGGGIGPHSRERRVLRTLISRVKIKRPVLWNGPNTKRHGTKVRTQRLDGSMYPPKKKK